MFDYRPVGEMVRKRKSESEKVNFLLQIETLLLTFESITLALFTSLYFLVTDFTTTISMFGLFTDDSSEAWAT